MNIRPVKFNFFYSPKINCLQLTPGLFVQDYYVVFSALLILRLGETKLNYTKKAFQVEDYLEAELSDEQISIHF